MSSETESEHPSVIFCLSSEEYSPNFLISWSEVIGYCISNNIKFAISHNYDRNPYFAKNGCLGGNPKGGKNQVPFGSVNYKKIIWLDNGISFKVSDFEKLINSDKDVVGGLYMSPNNRNFMSCREMNVDKLQNEGTFEFITPEEIANKIGDGELSDEKVEYTGMGFMCMKSGVLEKIDYPWFSPEKLEFSESGDFYPEDISLFKKLKMADVGVWVNPNIIVGYEKNINLLPYKLLDKLDTKSKLSSL